MLMRRLIRRGILFVSAVCLVFSSNVVSVFATNNSKSQNTPLTVQQIDIGGGYATALMSNGSLMIWGDNPTKQYGEDGNVIKNPTLVQGVWGVKEVVAGGGHIVTLMDDGSVMLWGSNYYGELGIKKQKKEYEVEIIPTPTVIPEFKNAVKILANNCTIALMPDGSLKATGDNSWGKLGANSSYTWIDTPTELPSAPGVRLTGVKHLGLGYDHAFAIMQNGTVKGWGRNFDGQVGHEYRKYLTAPIDVPGLTGVKQIKGGEGFTIALMEDGTVKSWGKNTDGQLGLEDTEDRLTPTTIPGLTGVKQLEVGLGVMALLNDGTVKVWGKNEFGLLGVGSTEDILTPKTMPGLTGVKQIAMGLDFAMVLMNDGTLKSWGNNEYGQLGLGDNLNRKIPTTITQLSPQKKEKATGEVFVILDPLQINFPDAQPFLDENGRTQVPVRFIVEAFGAEVDWDEKNKTVTIKNFLYNISLTIGQKTIKVNDVVKELDTAAILKDGRTFVPLRFVSEALGANVDWNGATNTATIR